jgi:hypothetical protein
MKALWAIQSNMMNQAGVDTMTSALERLDIDHVWLKSIPFSTDLPDVPTDRPVVFYGSVRWCDNIWRSRKWIPGVFFDDSFCMSEYVKRFGDRMLSSDIRFSTFHGFAQEEHNPDKKFFVRPDADSKRFSGKVMSFGEFQKWSREILEKNIDYDMPVCIATPCEIATEHRLFIVDGTVSTGSLYSTYGQIDQRASVSDEVLEFAEEVISIWNPLPAYVLDIGYNADEERYGVIEINCMNSAGFYYSDMLALVTDVTELAEKLWDTDLANKS